MDFELLTVNQRLSKLIRTKYRRSVIWIALSACFWLVTFNVQAIGLGRIVVNSALNQPLDAEISIASIEDNVLDGLVIRLATDSDFRRANISIDPVVKLLQFNMVNGETGPWIHVTTDSPIRSPFLHFLATIEWSGGKIIREYTALLNPPGYDTVAGKLVALPSTTDQPTIQPGDTYESVKSGETLMGIATRIDVDQNVTIYQRMFALMHINSEAFIRGNMNLLREGTTLIVPTVEMMASISRILAREEYTRQLSDWMGYRQGVEQGRAESGQRLWVSLVPGKETVVVKEVEKTIVKEVSSDTAKASPDSKSKHGGTSTTAATTEEYVLRIVQPIPDAQPEKVSEDTNSVADPTDQSAIEFELEKVRNRLILTEETLASKDLENEQLLRQIAILAEQIDKSAKIIALQDEALALAQQQATLRTQKIATIDSDQSPNEPSTESSHNTVQASVLADTEKASTTKDAIDQAEVAKQSDDEKELSTTTNESDAEVKEQSSDDTVQASVLADTEKAATSKIVPDQVEVAEQELHLSKNRQLLLICGVAAIVILLIVFLIRRGRQQEFQLTGSLTGGDEGDRMAAATQLDLARAYIEMGDKNAARNALNEAVQHGDADQKANAQAMLTELQTDNRD